MKKFLLFSISFVIHFALPAQVNNDIYLSKAGTITIKDSAYSYIKFVKHSDLWFGKEFYLTTNKLKSEGTYTNKDLSRPIGIINHYREEGWLDFATEYNDAHSLITKTVYFTNGNIKSYTTFKNNRTISIKEWNLAGKAVKKKTSH